MNLFCKHVWKINSSDWKPPTTKVSPSKIEIINWIKHDSFWKKCLSHCKHQVSVSYCPVKTICPASLWSGRGSLCCWCPEATTEYIWWGQCAGIYYCVPFVPFFPFNLSSLFIIFSNNAKVRSCGTHRHWLFSDSTWTSKIDANSYSASLSFSPGCHPKLHQIIYD